MSELRATELLEPEVPEFKHKEPAPGKFPVQCPECGRVMLNSTLVKHRKANHDVRLLHDKTLLASMRVDVPYKITKGRPTKASQQRYRKALPHSAEEQQRPRKATTPKKVARPSAEALIEVVLKALYPSGNAPLGHVRAISEYTTATEKFLADIE